MNIDDKTFKEGSYRYNMCTAPATIKAWPILKKMFDSSEYRDRIENTINLNMVRNIEA